MHDKNMNAHLYTREDIYNYVHIIYAVPHSLNLILQHSNTIWIYLNNV